jgi:hypothetical protein
VPKRGKYLSADTSSGHTTTGCHLYVVDAWSDAELTEAMICGKLEVEALRLTYGASVVYGLPVADRPEGCDQSLGGSC